MLVTVDAVDLSPFAKKIGRLEKNIGYQSSFIFFLLLFCSMALDVIPGSNFLLDDARLGECGNAVDLRVFLRANW